MEPVVKQVVVPATLEKAFDRFTSEVDRWWPKETHSVSKDRCRTVIWKGPEGTELHEIDDSGTRHVWGTFTAWEPPTRFAMTWHPGRAPSTAQRIEVTFESADGGTLVTLRHAGFEALGEDAAEIRAEYDAGWVGVLGRLSASLE